MIILAFLPIFNFVCVLGIDLNSIHVQAEAIFEGRLVSNINMMNVDDYLSINCSWQEYGTGSSWMSEIPQHKKSCPRLSWFYVPHIRIFLFTKCLANEVPFKEWLDHHHHYDQLKYYFVLPPLCWWLQLFQVYICNAHATPSSNYRLQNLNNDNSIELCV